MTPALPLFPLSTVLFPGLVLPLRVFEQRYRTMVHDIMARPAGVVREFGVVAIRRGLEANDSAATFYGVGCTAEVRNVTQRPDGEYDLVTVGRHRFEITDLVPADTPYVQARVRYLAESANVEAASRLTPTALALFRRYLALIRTDAGVPAEQLPENPVVLSHVIAATAALTIAERQALLATVDTAARLRAELVILRREVAILDHVRAVPMAVDQLPVTPSSN